VVLVSIDTLRSDRLPAYGYRGVATPAIDALRHDAILFERAYSHTPLTLPSHTTMLSGLLPERHGIRDNAGYRFDAAAIPTVPSLLRAKGYRTGAAVSSFVLNAGSGLGAAFEHYDDREPGSEDQQRTGELTLQRALDWLRQDTGKPFFLFLHLYEPHTPYTPPEPFASRYADPYDGEIATADALVGKLVAELQRLGLYDRSIVVLLSDHGEGLGEHGEMEHGFFLYRETLQVPLLLKLPGSARGGTAVAAPAQLLDLAPTLLAATGADAPEGLEGTDLLRLDEPDAPARRIYSETFFPRLHYGWSELTSLVEGRWHYIHGATPELFDVVADPGETRNVMAEQRRALAGLRDAIRGYDVTLAPPGQVDAETARKLAALGYTGTSVRVTGGDLPDPRTKRHVLRQLQEAEKALKADRCPDVVPIVERVLADTPAMVDGWTLLAGCHNRMQDHESALAAYQRALELTGGAPYLALHVGRQLLALGRLDEAAEHAEIARAIEPREADGLLAEVALERGALDEALRLLRGDAKVPPTYRRDLGMALSEKGRVAESIEVLQPLAAGGMEPSSANALAIALSEAGRQGEAAAVARRVVESDPGNARAHEILGIVALREGRAAEARSELEKALELNRQLPNAWNTLGVALYELEGPAAALAAWQQAVALEPQRHETLYNIGLVAAQIGRRAEARQALRRFVSTAPPERYAADIGKAQQLLRELGG
jgi:arylsulfatase A-like enzyme/Flp pilus assembly protein TadD